MAEDATAPLVEQRLTRREINKRVGKAKRMIKWATAEEMIPSSIFHALQAVEGLRRGRSALRSVSRSVPSPDGRVRSRSTSMTLAWLTVGTIGLG